MRTAYTTSLKTIAALATNPESIRVDPIEKAWFKMGSSKYGQFVTTMVAFYGQNSYGATIRSTATCSYWIVGAAPITGAKSDCLSSPHDFLALGLGTEGMIQIPKTTNEIK